MNEKKLEKLINEAKVIRQENIENGTANYYYEVFSNLSNFLMKKLSNNLFSKQNAKLIVNHFDEILPFIVANNVDLLFMYSYKLVENKNFKTKFIEGLKKYPYKRELRDIFYNIWACLIEQEWNIYDSFIDNDILDTLSELHLSRVFYMFLLNKVNEEKQKYFLESLVKNKCNIPYNGIYFLGKNKDIIYNNIDLFIENSVNLYDLMNFVKDNDESLSKTKEFLDTHEDKAFESIFSETDEIEDSKDSNEYLQTSDEINYVGSYYTLEIKDNTIKEVIKLTIKDIMKNEQVNFSDITYKEGGFSKVFLIGDKVLKLGDRATKTIPNNPYIVSPLLRRELESNGEKIFIEVTERVDTESKVSKEELYNLYKNIRNLGLKWTDIKTSNVGRLTKENIIHWNKELNPSEGVLGLTPMRGDNVLKGNDLVILDADFIYDEKDPNINYSNEREIYNEFESRYQKELRDLSNEEVINEEEITQEKRR